MGQILCGQLNLEEFSDDEKIASDSQAWIKIDVEPRLVLRTLPDELLPRPHAIIKFSQACVVSLCSDHLNANRGTQNFIRNLNINKDDQDANAAGGENGPPNDLTFKGIGDADSTTENQIEHGRGGLDQSSLNSFEFQSQAIIPTAAVIPMKSSIKRYGPWASSNWSLDRLVEDGKCGGIDIQANQDLVPWNYGSSLALQQVAETLVEFSNIGLTRSEMGSVTVPQLPENVDRLGVSLNAVGPTLTGVNVTFGSSGITTSYDFKTYTPKFGRLNKLYVDQFKIFAQARRDQLRFLKNQAVNQYRIARNARNKNIERILRNQQSRAQARQASLQRIMVGETFKLYEGTRENEGPTDVSMVGLETLAKSVNEMVYDYEKKAFISIDGLFSPVSISGDGDLQRFAILPDPESPLEYTDISGMENIIGYVESGKVQSKLVNGGTKHFAHHSSTLHAIPPYYSGTCEDTSFPTDKTHEFNNIKIRNMYLNPLANPNSIPHGTGIHDVDEHDGHNIGLVGRELEIPESGLINHAYPKNDEQKYSDDYRFLGLRGPLILHSWGYDTEGKPIPNYIDNEHLAASGVFLTSISGETEGSQASGLTEHFMPNWLQKPSTWPVGPVDLRFDRERGVWVSPPPFRIITARITSSVPAFGAGEAFIVTNDTTRSNIKRLTTNTGSIIPDGSGCIFKTLKCLFEGDDPEEVFDPEEILENSTATLLGIHIPMSEIEYVNTVIENSGDVTYNKKKIKVSAINMTDPDPVIVDIYDCSSYISPSTTGDWVVYEPCGPMAGSLQIYTDAEYEAGDEICPGIPGPVVPVAPPSGTTIEYNDECYHLVGLLQNSLPPDPAVYVASLTQTSIGSDCGACASLYVTYTNCLEDTSCADPIGYYPKAVAVIPYEDITPALDQFLTANIGAVYQFEGNCWELTATEITRSFTYPPSYEPLAGIITEEYRVVDDDCTACLTKSIWVRNCCCTDTIKTKKINVICPTIYDEAIDGLVINEIYPIEDGSVGILPSGCYKYLGTSETLFATPSIYTTLGTLEDINNWNIDKTNGVSECIECEEFVRETYDPTFECQPSGVPGAMIRVVDRIGVDLSVGKNIYAYYDTTTGEYIALGYQGSTTNNRTAIVVGDVTRTGSNYSMSSVSIVLGDLSVTTTIDLTNPMNIYIPDGDTFKGWAVINFGG